MGWGLGVDSCFVLFCFCALLVPPRLPNPVQGPRLPGGTQGPGRWRSGSSACWVLGWEEAGQWGPRETPSVTGWGLGRPWGRVRLGRGSQYSPTKPLFPNCPTNLLPARL